MNDDMLLRISLGVFKWRSFFFLLGFYGVFSELAKIHALN
jgi:hypothetical protein